VCSTRYGVSEETGKCPGPIYRRLPFPFMLTLLAYPFALKMTAAYCSETAVNLYRSNMDNRLPRSDRSENLKCSSLLALGRYRFARCCYGLEASVLLHSSSVRGQECIALLHMNKLSPILIYSPFLQYQILMRKLLGKVGKHKEQCTHLSSSRRGFELSTRTTKGPQLSTQVLRVSLPFRQSLC
jgi:hypothetical protein